MPKKSDKQTSTRPKSSAKAGKGKNKKTASANSRGGAAVVDPPASKKKSSSANKDVAKKSGAKKSAAKSTHAERKRADRLAKKAAEEKVYTAATADKHELYELSVQSPEEDVKFIRRTYKAIRGKQAKHLREDFSGTALLASHWIRRTDNTAEGFDIDEDTVGWGIERNFAPLGDVASRCTLHLKDVREPSNQKPDVRVALNFSYCLFKERKVLVDYMRGAQEDLAEDGIFILDIHGGPEAMEEMEEDREIEEGFDYVWDQDRYWPATGDYKCYIHFEFEDGTRMEKAFAYDWRLWGLPEVVDCLKDAGFSKVDTYWEGTDEDGESGDGNFRRKKKGENCLSWISYVVCEK